MWGPVNLPGGTARNHLYSVVSTSPAPNSCAAAANSRGCSKAERTSGRLWTSSRRSKDGGAEMPSAISGATLTSSGGAADSKAPSASSTPTSARRAAATMVRGSNPRSTTMPCWRSLCLAATHASLPRRFRASSASDDAPEAHAWAWRSPFAQGQRSMRAALGLGVEQGRFNTVPRRASRVPASVRQHDSSARD
eukprot:CAMPEP_0117543574 /NCGR_PEP_ID=MMETSP0784-20121206/45130_1 /TAXON_ID=39447 /ORGANISM="" /LENGTH=193 /DNA_ID=CAMNT_0005340355 /DNA_START=423 /DNA_END=1001 /DNA_ORIENTATION=-